MRRGQRLARAQRQQIARGVPALLAEVAEARAALDRPAARRHRRGRRSSRCALMRSRRCWRPARWSSTPAAAACAPARRGSRLRAGRCSSRWCARSPRPGPAMSIATRLIARAFRTRRPDEIAPSTTTRRDRPFAQLSPRRWRASRPRERGFVLSPLGSVNCRPGARPSKASRRRCWRCSPTARPGPPRPSRWRSAPASAPCSARSSS